MKLETVDIQNMKFLQHLEPVCRLTEHLFLSVAEKSRLDCDIDSKKTPRNQQYRFTCYWIDRNQVFPPSSQRQRMWL